MKPLVHNGKVAYLYQAGKDLVSGELEVSVAQAIVKGGKKTKCEDKPYFPLCVDDKWYFPIEEEPTIKPSKKGRKTPDNKE